MTTSIINKLLSNKHLPHDFHARFCILEDLPHKYKIVIAGNHDFSLEENVFEKESGRTDLKNRFQLNFTDMDLHLSENGVKHAKDLLRNAVYLKDSEVTVFGIRVYGSPW